MSRRRWPLTMYAIALTASTVYRWARSNTIPLKDKHRILEHYSGPMRILHGEHDRNVPLSAAKEHHRLVPQTRWWHSIRIAS